MIRGGAAHVIYGDPRFTRDIDVVKELDASEVTAPGAVSDLISWEGPAATVTSHQPDGTFRHERVKGGAAATGQ